MEIRYKKQTVKRYVKIEKIKYRKYHINDFNLLVKILFPKRKVTNIYAKLIDKVDFTDYQKKLIKQTTQSFTILNEMHREQDKWGQLYAVREDMVNAVNLLQNEIDFKNPEYLFPPSLRWFYKQLQMEYTGIVFTNYQVRLHLRKSSSLVYRNLTELVDRELIEIVGKQRQAYVYQLKDE
jgi:hypothetical protein